MTEASAFVPMKGMTREIAVNVDWSSNARIIQQIYNGQEWVNAHSDAFLQIEKEMILGSRGHTHKP
jgi:DNA-dependent RNA polymerase auxiliary subunit epsilon